MLNILRKIKFESVAAIICAFFIWNFFLRLAIEKKPPQVYDDKMGFHLEAEEEYINSSEGFSKIKTDRFGFNNDRIENPINTSIDNIIFLGDSYTEALAVNRQNNYVKITEKLLNDNGYAFRSINLGISGNSIPDHIRNAPGFIKTFNPKYVIVQLHFNDFVDEALNPEHGNKIIKKENKYSIEHSIRSKKRTANHIADITGWFQPVSFRIINNAISSYQEKTFKKNEIHPSNDSEERNREEIQNIIDWQVRELKKAYGNKIVFLYFSPLPNIMEGTVNITENSSNTEKKEMVFNSAKKWNIDTFDIEDVLVEYYQKTHRMPRGFQDTRPGLGHLNAAGNYLVADSLYNYLSEKLNNIDLKK